MLRLRRRMRVHEQLPIDRLRQAVAVLLGVFGTVFAGTGFDQNAGVARLCRDESSVAPWEGGRMFRQGRIGGSWAQAGGGGPWGGGPCWGGERDRNQHQRLENAHRAAAPRDEPPLPRRARVL